MILEKLVNHILNSHEKYCDTFRNNIIAGLLLSAAPKLMKYTILDMRM